MNKRFKHISAFVIIVIITVFIPQKIEAQKLSGSFIMSSIGGIQNMANNSMAVTFTSNAACLNIQNGAAVLTGDRGLGAFAINCDVNTNLNSHGIKLFPNPVAANTKVKFINPPSLTDQFTITIWGGQGEKMSTINASGYELYQGKLLNLTALVSGSYIIQIESEKSKDALKFIKAN